MCGLLCVDGWERREANVVELIGPEQHVESNSILA